MRWAILALMAFVLIFIIASQTTAQNGVRFTPYIDFSKAFPNFANAGPHGGFGTGLFDIVADARRGRHHMRRRTSRMSWRWSERRDPAIQVARQASATVARVSKTD